MAVIFIDSKPKTTKIPAFDVEALCEIEFDGSVDAPDLSFEPGGARGDIQFDGSVTIFPIAGASIQFDGSAQSTDWFGGAKAEIEFSNSASGIVNVFFGNARGDIEFTGYADGSPNNPESYTIQVIVDVVSDWGDPFSD